MERDALNVLQRLDNFISAIHVVNIKSLHNALVLLFHLI